MINSPKDSSGEVEPTGLYTPRAIPLCACASAVPKGCPYQASAEATPDGDDGALADANKAEAALTSKLKLAS